MRIISGLLLFIGLVLIGGYIFAKGYPYRLYSNWIQGKTSNLYYSVKFDPKLLAPIPVDEIPPYQEDYVQLWREFPIRNAVVPLPVRHPLFQTIPIIDSLGKDTAPQLGVAILAPNGRELSRIYTLPTRILEDYSHGQELFKLPFVRNRILKFDSEKVWSDLFEYKIIVESKSLEEMIYDLYILHLRAKLFHPETIKYGRLNNERVVLEIVSADKDYIIELVMKNDHGRIYSYILRTEKNNDESTKLRGKFLEQISFNPADTAMTKFLYTEFKQMNFSRQVDQEGMLYLLSAWSQDLDNTELLKEMIYFLERGKNKGLQLRPLYRFALKHYGKTFTTKSIFNNHEDPSLILQRRIEIEAIEKANLAARQKAQGAPEIELTPDEQMNIYLKKAKEAGPVEKDDMVIH